jgi:CubicO group peptidase (beta-lactamase class C family)
MQFVEQGKLDLDADVNRYLDNWIRARQQTPSKRRSVKKLTLRRLLD